MSAGGSHLTQGFKLLDVQGVGVALRLAHCRDGVGWWVGGWAGVRARGSLQTRADRGAFEYELGCR